jgi:hypothetical protein
MISLAEPGPNGGMSAGVAILARPHIGLGLPLVGTEEIIPARMIAARIEAPGSRPFTAIAAYFHDGQGLAFCNLEMLRVAGLFIKSQGDEAPFVMGADFQVEPHEIAAAAFGQEVGATLMATGDAAGTCRTGRTARELDYFYVSSGLADGVESIGLIQHTGIRTHLPVELRFKPRLASIRALVIRKPPPSAPRESSDRFGRLRLGASWSKRRPSWRPTRSRRTCPSRVSGSGWASSSAVGPTRRRRSWPRRQWRASDSPSMACEVVHQS